LTDTSPAQTHEVWWLEKFTWSINISTGGPLYDFTSSQASYFYHTDIPTHP